jgi:hypothetical protein
MGEAYDLVIRGASGRGRYLRCDPAASLAPRARSVVDPAPL